MTQVLLFLSWAYALKLVGPFGERSAFLGNTGVVVGDSNAAVVYNPANLMTLTKDRFSASATSLSSFRYTQGALGGRAESITPLAVSSSFKASESAWGWGLYSPIALEFAVTGTFNGIAESFPSLQTLGTVTQTQLLGAVGYAFRWRRFHLGASIVGRRSNEEQVLVFHNFNPTIENQYGLSITQDQTRESTYLSAVLGLSLDLGDAVMGLSVSLPEQLVAATGQLRQVSSVYGPGESPEFRGDALTAEAKVIRRQRLGVRFGVQAPIGPSVDSFFSLAFSEPNETDVASEAWEVGLGLQYETFRLGYQRDISRNLSVQKERGGWQHLVFGYVSRTGQLESSVGLFYAETFDFEESGDITGVLLSSTFSY